VISSGPKGTSRSAVTKIRGGMIIPARNATTTANPRTINNIIVKTSKIMLAQLIIDLFCLLKFIVILSRVLTKPMKDANINNTINDT
jgi:hypothetical protein